MSRVPPPYITYLSSEGIDHVSTTTQTEAWCVYSKLTRSNITQNNFVPLIPPKLNLKVSRKYFITVQLHGNRPLIVQLISTGSYELKSLYTYNNIIIFWCENILLSYCRCVLTELLHNITGLRKTLSVHMHRFLYSTKYLQTKRMWFALIKNLIKK